MNLAGQLLIGLCHSLDVEILQERIWQFRGKHRPNYVSPHVVKQPPAVDWLGTSRLELV